jgi:transketolase
MNARIKRLDEIALDAQPELAAARRFGASAPGKENFGHCGFSVDKMAAKAMQLAADKRQ